MEPNSADHDNTVKPAGAPSDDKADREWHRQLYNDNKKQAWDDIQSSTDSYDQSLLTLSSGVLALSLAFIKDIVPAQDAIWLWMLYSSWTGFGACIVVTVLSFRFSVEGQKEHLKQCEKYYIGRDESALNAPNKFSDWLSGCTIASGTLFILGLALTIIFAIGNIQRSSKMPHDDKTSITTDGRGIMAATPIPSDKKDDRGRTPMDKTPAAPPPPPPVVTGAPKEK